MQVAPASGPTIAAMPFPQQQLGCSNTSCRATVIAVQTTLRSPTKLLLSISNCEESFSWM